MSMEDLFPPYLTSKQTAELKRRQRVRNVALLAVLIGVVALFYAIAVVKFKVH